MFEMEVCRPEALGSSLEPSLQPAHHPLLQQLLVMNLAFELLHIADVVRSQWE